MYGSSIMDMQNWLVFMLIIKVKTPFEERVFTLWGKWAWKYDIAF